MSHDERSLEGPTPRTDANAKNIGAYVRNPGEWIEAVSADFARQLERELAEAKDTIGTLRIAAEHLEREYVSAARPSATSRDAVLEEAARECFLVLPASGQYAAAAIRALKERAAPQAQVQGDVGSLETAGQPAELASRCVVVPREVIQWIQNAHDEMWPGDPKEMLARAITAITQSLKS